MSTCTVVLRIPLPQFDVPIYPPPSLRKTLKSNPFETRKQVKSRRRHRFHSYQPRNLVYPEISTLSATDIANDLDYLYQNRRVSSPYVTPFGGTPPLWGPNSSFAPRNGSNGLHAVRTQGFGVLPPLPLAHPVMGPSPPGSMMHQHPLAYEPYSGDMPPYGGPPPPPRIRDQPVGTYTHGPGGFPSTGSRDSYPEFSAPVGRGQPSSSLHGSGAHGYSVEHEMNAMVHGGNSGHQVVSYYGQGKVGSRMSPLPSSSSTFSGMKGVGINGRHSPSPPPQVSVNGAKQNGNWMDMGINIGSFQVGNGNGGGRDVRILNEDEERDRIMRERGDRKRVEKEFDRRDQWDREYPDFEREHGRDQPHIQHFQQRQLHQHGHSSSSSGPPTQVSGMEPHHLSGHHHRPHHHHVLHRHGPLHASSSLPSPGPSGPGGAPPIVHSPRSTRDYDPPRPPSATHPGPSQSHSTNEAIMLPSSSKSHQPIRERDIPRSDHSVQHSPSMHDYRDRDRDREMRKPYMHRPPSGPPLTSLELTEDRNERSNATPFALGSPHSMPPPLLGMPHSSHLNGSGVGGFVSSPKGQSTWNASVGEDSYRMPSSGYLGGPSSHDHRSPVQAHRYPPSGVPPLGRGIPSNSSSSSLHRITSPPPLSSRARPSQSPSYPPHSTLHRSPQTRYVHTTMSATTG